MDREKRLRSFEKMLEEIQKNYENVENKMRILKTEGKEKTATYRQLMGNKLQYQNMLAMYRIYGLLDE